MDSLNESQSANEIYIDSVVVQSLPRGELDAFMNYPQILATKIIVELGLDSKQVEDSLRRLVKTKDNRINFYQDGTASCFPDDFGSYRYKKTKNT